MTGSSPTFLCLVVLLTLGVTPSSEHVSVRHASVRHVSIRPGLLPRPLATQTPERQERLEKGKFLVAANHLNDPNFSQTVIYLVAYSQRGALGVVVNRPTDVQLARAMPHLEDRPHAEDFIYAGGPVGRTRMLLLIRSDTFPLEEVLPITEEISVTSSLDNLAMLAAAATAQFRVYAGYAGWSPSQLDYEVARGDWRVMPGTPSTLFGADPQNLWSTLMKKGDSHGAEWVHRVDSPVDSP